MPKSTFCDGVGCNHSHWEISTSFCTLRSETSQRYISDILEAELFPWACNHFDGVPWTLQQDSTPSHGSKMTQSFIQAYIPAFDSKDEWSSRSPDLNPLDFSVWSIL